MRKADSPILPSVNWKHAPVYKLARMLSRNLDTFIPLPHAFNIKNTIQLMNDLLDNHFDQDLKFVSVNIMNIYSNIPITELIKIIEIMCKQNDLNIEIKNEIITMCNILTKQNYFQYEDLQYIQEDGLAMGPRTSSFFSEICLQYLESTKIFDILLKYHIIGYFQYVGDILIVYKNEVTNIQEELDSFNNTNNVIYYGRRSE